MTYEKVKERLDIAYGIYYVDGSRIEAFGENNFPKNFNEVFSELAARIRGHDDNGILEIDRPAVGVRNPSLIQNLQ